VVAIRSAVTAHSDAEAKIVTFRIIAVTIAVLACALAISTYPTFGHTWDEPEHIAAGMQLLDRGVYTYDVQHPPLARVAMAVGPYLAGARSYGEPGPSGEQEGRDLLYRTGNYDRLLTLARLGLLPFFIVLMGATWLWARHYFGAAEAALATFFIACTPPLVGHAAIAALDIPGAAFCTLAMYLMVRWMDQPSLKWSVLFGGAAGLAVGTKLSAVPFLIVVALAWTAVFWFKNGSAVVRERVSSGRNWLRTALVAVVALAATSLCYGVHFERLTDAGHRPNEALDYLVGSKGRVHDMVYDVAAHIAVPLGTERFVLSIAALQKHNGDGHLSYFRGELRRSGWWDFYIVALGLKTPLPLLGLGLAGLGWLAWRTREGAWTLATPTVAFATLLLFCSAYSHINIGVRHVFVLYPLLAIGAAALTMKLWRSYERIPLRAGLVALLVWQTSSLWNSHPDYLAYFNEIAGRHPEHYLIDSDLDWGQDMRRLEQRLHERHIDNFSFVYRGTADLIREDLPHFILLPPFVHATGWVAAGLLAKVTGAEGEGYLWLNKYQPVERVGKSIDLYYIPPEAE
jgi:hypothetical protein